MHQPVVCLCIASLLLVGRGRGGYDRDDTLLMMMTVVMMLMVNTKLLIIFIGQKRWHRNILTR